MPPMPPMSHDIHSAYVHAIALLVNNGLPHPEVLLSSVALRREALRRASFDVDVWGGVARPRYAAIRYDPTIERLALIETIEMLTWCALRAWSWIAQDELKGLSHDARRMANRLGICRDATQVVEVRWQHAYFDRETDKPYPIDAHEDRSHCLFCKRPIGSWEGDTKLHAGCTSLIRSAARLRRTRTNEPEKRHYQ